MKVTILVNRVLTEAEAFATDRFSYYYDNQKTFAVVGDNAVVVMAEHETHERIVELSKESMNSLLNAHPDFNSYIMDDGNVLVEMLYNVYSVLDGKQAGLLPTDEKVPIHMALAARSACLKAAGNCEVIAIVEPDKSVE